MKSIKKIIGIVGDFGFFEKNKKNFEDLDILVLQVKNEDDLEKCDGIFFGTSSFFQLKNYFGDEFFDKILFKIENNFPVFCVGQSINLFLDKIGDIGKGGFLNKESRVEKMNSEIVLDFLDSKKMNIKIFKNFFYKEKSVSGLKKYFLKNKKRSDFDFFGNEKGEGELVYIYKKTLFLIFSPEFYGDKRIYEYFVNNFF